MKQHKDEVITFKVDAALMDELRKVPNRSAFIRTAVKTALDSVCPLCQGTGDLSPDQKNHWEEFARHHRVIECKECHELHLVCATTARKA